MNCAVTLFYCGKISNISFLIVVNICSEIGTDLPELFQEQFFEGIFSHRPRTLPTVASKTGVAIGSSSHRINIPWYAKQEFAPRCAVPRYQILSALGCDFFYCTAAGRATVEREVGRFPFWISPPHHNQQNFFWRPASGGPLSGPGTLPCRLFN